MFDFRDQVTLSTCPVVAMPRFSPLPPTQYGQRVVVARNGVFLHTFLPWLDCLHPIGTVEYRTLPYGTADPYMRFAFGAVGPEHIEAFIALARTRLPNECAASLVYSCATGALKMRECAALHCSARHVHFQQPPLAPDDIIAVDLHSHGRARAFFSSQDDEDDLGIKIAIVVGSLESPIPTCVCRLVINGYYIPLASPWPRGAPTGGVEFAHC